MALIVLLALACGSPPEPEPVDTDVVDDTPSGCEVGTSRACACDGVAGLQTCLGNDTWSACGCDDPETSPEDLYVPPDPPVDMTCADGTVPCPPYRGDDPTEISANHCCLDAVCGSEAAFVFGDRCVPRGGDPGTRSGGCPDEYPNFLDLFGCCRPDGWCGLSLDHLSNWDIGCVERSQMSQWLNGGSGVRDGLSRDLGYPVEPASFAAMRCP